MTNRPLGPTVRDFSKTQAARNFLKGKFKFEAIPRPNLSPLKTDKNIPANLLGTTFDYLLLLLMERSNPDFAFQISFGKHFVGSRSKLRQALNNYFKTGTLDDTLIGELISYGEKRQRSFQQSRRQEKLIIFDSLKDELRRMHHLAAKINWSIKESFQQGWLTSGRSMRAIPDLILDRSLIEVKSTKDAEGHDEYLSQLLCYHVMFQSSKGWSSASLNEIGIYYARHGVLAKSEITEVLRFPPTHIKRVAFDFEVELQYWRDGVHPLQSRIQNPSIELEPRRWMLFNEVLEGIHPKPPWLEKALEKRFKKTKRGLSPQQIKIPEDYLID